MSLAKKIAEKKAATETASGAVTSLPLAPSRQATLRVFTSTYAGFNYKFASGKVAVFKAYAGAYKYYATEKEAEELRSVNQMFVTEEL